MNIIEKKVGIILNKFLIRQVLSLWALIFVRDKNFKKG